MVLAGFIVWQRFNKGEPLLPLDLFRDRNFSLANIGITTVGFTVTAFGLPLIFYYQMVRGMTPTQSALMMVPMALISGGLAPVVGKIIDRVNPKYITAGGLVLMAVALFWNSVLMHPDTPILLFLLPSAVLGFANAGIWAPLSSTATRNLPPRQAGAGSGVYNTTRQIGAVLGSAAIAVLIQARLAAELPGAGGAGGGGPGLLRPAAGGPPRGVLDGDGPVHPAAGGRDPGGGSRGAVLRQAQAGAGLGRPGTGPPLRPERAPAAKIPLARRASAVSPGGRWSGFRRLTGRASGPAPAAPVLLTSAAIAG